MNEFHEFLIRPPSPMQVFPIFFPGRSIRHRLRRFVACGMFSAPVWSYNADPEQFSFTSGAGPSGSYDGDALDGVSNFLEAEDGEGDLETEREHEILLLKAYTDQLDAELHTPGSTAPSESPNFLSPAPTKSHVVSGVRSAPGEVLVRSRKRLLNRSGSSSSSSSDSEQSNDPALDDLKLGERPVPLFPPAKRRRLNSKAKVADHFVVDDSDSDSEPQQAPKRGRPRSSSSSGSSASEEDDDVLLAATNALHAVHGHSTFADLPPLLPPLRDLPRAAPSTQKSDDETDNSILNVAEFRPGPGGGAHGVRDS